jgi:hypothetical protein
MHDETVPIEATPETPAPVASPPRPLPHWLKRLFVCNPFFLASAMLLLYGLYRVSIDPNFLATEVAQLTFNFTSLQCYELLLVVTAAVLARRHLWHDSTVLVLLENLFLLVPFILISQAALIEPRFVWSLCAVAVALAGARTEAARRLLRQLWPAPRFFALGAIALLANGALPVIYRLLHEGKIGTRLASGPAWAMDQLAWLVLLPALCALSLLLPKLDAEGHHLKQRRWLPPTLFSFWILGTAVHLYCLGYVYDFALSRHLLAPSLWVLAWILFRKLPDFASAPALRAGAMALPLPMALVAATATGSHVFALLMLANAVCYAGIALRERDNRFALHLSLISAAAAVAGAPLEWMLPKFAGLDRAKLITMALASYCVLACLLSRDPKAGLAGGFVTGCGVGYLLGATAGGGWAVQLGLVFFLLHSLRWKDHEHVGASGVRIFATAIWVAHTFFWARNGAGWPGGLVLPALILVCCASARWWDGYWVSRTLPVAALAAATCAPVNYTATKVQTLPVGVLAIAGSFALLGLGALAALTKHRWHPPETPHEPP